MNINDLSVQECREIVWGDSEDYIIMYDRMIGQTRWSILHEIVVKHKPTEKFYYTAYYIASTEMQDEKPWEWDKPEWAEVRQIEKVIIAYEVI